MKLISTSFVFFLICTTAFGQIIFQDNLNWEQAAKKAKAEKKLIFLHLENSKCQQCNDVATQGFSSPDLKDKFEKNFISLRANVETERGRKLAEKFQIRGALISLFIDADGNILNRYNGSTSRALTYDEQAEIALGRKDEKHLSDYEKEYKAGARSSGFLEEFIVKRKEVTLPVDDLLEEYVGRLPVDSLGNYEVLKFVYLQGPSLDSKVYKVIKAVVPQQTIDSLYKSVAVDEAVAMNKAIIESTFRKAVQNRDKRLAYELSAFIQGTYQHDYAQAQLAGTRSLLRYYYAARDTTEYIQSMEHFLDFNHMRLTVDSLKRLDASELKKKLDNYTGNKGLNRPFPGMQGQPAPVTVSTFSFTPPSHYFHVELNEHAWHLYEMSDKPRDLENGLKWSRQAILFSNALNKDRGHPYRLGIPAYLDTYAHLLYKLGRRDEAVEWQTKAVEAQNVTGQPNPSLEATLKEMKAGTLKKGR
jgi:thioredoxin-related protein